MAAASSPVRNSIWASRASLTKASYSARRSAWKVWRATGATSVMAVVANAEANARSAATQLGALVSAAEPAAKARVPAGMPRTYVAVPARRRRRSCWSRSRRASSACRASSASTRATRSLADSVPSGGAARSSWSSSIGATLTTPECRLRRAQQNPTVCGASSPNRGAPRSTGCGNRHWPQQRHAGDCGHISRFCYRLGPAALQVDWTRFFGQLRARGASR